MRWIMSKLIIHNFSSVSDIDALEYVKKVITGGRISGQGEKKQYCYLTQFAVGDNLTIDVAAFLNDKSDSFNVSDG